MGWADAQVSQHWVKLWLYNSNLFQSTKSNNNKQKYTSKNIFSLNLFIDRQNPIKHYASLINNPIPSTSWAIKQTKLPFRFVWVYSTFPYGYILIYYSIFSTFLIFSSLILSKNSFLLNNFLLPSFSIHVRIYFIGLYYTSGRFIFFR